MPPHPDLFLAILVVILGLGIVTTAAFFAGFTIVRVFPGWSLRRSEASDSIPCRYCVFGRAHAREETVRVEDADLVAVTCYVCGSCSLPQWRVERSPVLKRAACATNLRRSPVV